MQNKIHDPTLFAGLTALAESTFPKKCHSCGRQYADVKSFIAETQDLAHHTGLKASTDYDGETLVELFRNCVCGSTLLDFFNDRRDLSDEGTKRRKTFSDLLSYLEARGIDNSQARLEILKVLKGGHSEQLSQLRPNKP